MAFFILTLRNAQSSKEKVGWAGEESGVQGPGEKTTHWFNEMKEDLGFGYCGCVSLNLKVL